MSSQTLEFGSSNPQGAAPQAVFASTGIAARPLDLATQSPGLATQYSAVRRFTHRLCEPLATEDYVIQSMPDVSPTKWHIAHTSWFFETFILGETVPGYRPFHPRFNYLFNSYYNTIGERHPRPIRGLLSRPTVEEVFRYRAYVDEHMAGFLDRLDADLAANGPDAALACWAPLVAIGLHHEQQHQELLVTDIKNVFAINPLRPAYRPQAQAQSHLQAPALRGEGLPALDWRPFEGGVYEIGLDPAGGAQSALIAERGRTAELGRTAFDTFAFDNESPRHHVYLEPFALGSRLVTNGEYLAFMGEDGYRRPEFWLSDGWYAVQANGWAAPMYWEREGAGHDGWQAMTLAGMRAVDEDEPVCHVSLYEADAYARWAGARLATEAEWEVAAQSVPVKGNFVDDFHFHPVPSGKPTGPGMPTGHGRNGARPQAATVVLHQMFGDVWEWTASSYSPYPGYRPAAGALGEYNGKFMCNQLVLRGGSCATSANHIRATYRNFFPADARWQFSGIRLARNV